MVIFLIDVVWFYPTATSPQKDHRFENGGLFPLFSNFKFQPKGRRSLGENTDEVFAVPSDASTQAMAT